MQNAVTKSGLESLPDYAAMLAKYGRKGDTYLAHVAKGETVIPLKILDDNPTLKAMLFDKMRERGLDPQRYIVGDELNSINPVTGQPEFFWDDVWDGVKDALKIAAPVLGAIAGSFIPIPIVGPMIGSFVASKIAGYDTQDALMGAAASGIGAFALSGSATAALGGYGTTASSLGSSLYNGLTQQGLSKGLAGLVTAAPAAAQLPTAAGSAFANTAAAAAPAAAPAAGTAAAAAPAATNFASGTVFAPLVNFGIKNPGAVLAGGAMLASILDKPENVKPQMTDMRSGYDVYKKNPEKYNIGNLNVQRSPNRLSAYETASLYRNTPVIAVEDVPTVNYDPSFSNYPVVDFEGGKWRKNAVMARDGGHIQGPGTGTSDSIPAMLSDGEFVMTAKAVRGAGAGDRKKGARKMYQLMKQFEELNG